MPEQISITIVPSGNHPDILTVQDAMEQILDIFKLLEGDDGIIWKLVSVSMQSPLNATAEATSYRPGVDYESIAKEQKSNFHSSLSSVAEGVLPVEWSTGSNLQAASRVFKRSTNGIGQVIFDFHEDFPSISINYSIAEEAIKAIQRSSEDHQLIELEVNDSHKEQGSVDGLLIEIGVFYNQPAIKIRDRLTSNEIWCIIPKGVQNEISKHVKISDVWSKRRIIIDGDLQYNKNGNISKITAKEIEFIDPRPVELEEIFDKDFTDGLTAIEYINRLRG